MTVKRDNRRRTETEERIVNTRLKGLRQTFVNVDRLTTDDDVDMFINVLTSIYCEFYGSKCQWKPPSIMYPTSLPAGMLRSAPSAAPSSTEVPSLLPSTQTIAELTEFPTVQLTKVPTVQLISKTAIPVRNELVTSPPSAIAAVPASPPSSAPTPLVVSSLALPTAMPVTAKPVISPTTKPSISPPTTLECSSSTVDCPCISQMAGNELALQLLRERFGSNVVEVTNFLFDVLNNLPMVSDTGCSVLEDGCGTPTPSPISSTEAPITPTLPPSTLPISKSLPPSQFPIATNLPVSRQLQRRRDARDMQTTVTFRFQEVGQTTDGTQTLTVTYDQVISYVDISGKNFSEENVVRLPFENNETMSDYENLLRLHVLPFSGLMTVQKPIPYMPLQNTPSGTIPAPLPQAKQINEIGVGWLIALVVIGAVIIGMIIWSLHDLVLLGRYGKIASIPSGQSSRHFSDDPSSRLTSHSRRSSFWPYRSSSFRRLSIVSDDSRQLRQSQRSLILPDRRSSRSNSISHAEGEGVAN